MKQILCLSALFLSLAVTSLAQGISQPSLQGEELEQMLVQQAHQFASEYIQTDYLTYPDSNEPGKYLMKKTKAELFFENEKVIVVDDHAIFVGAVSLKEQNAPKDQAQNCGNFHVLFVKRKGQWEREKVWLSRK